MGFLEGGAGCLCFIRVQKKYGVFGGGGTNG